jgi:hypothetical protein
MAFLLNGLDARLKQAHPACEIARIRHENRRHRSPLT